MYVDHEQIIKDISDKIETNEDFKEALSIITNAPIEQGNINQNGFEVVKCMMPGHDDKNASFNIKQTGNGVYGHCFGCKTKGNFKTIFEELYDYQKDWNEVDAYCKQLISIFNQNNRKAKKVKQSVPLSDHKDYSRTFLSIPHDIKFSDELTKALEERKLLDIVLKYVSEGLIRQTENTLFVPSTIVNKRMPLMQRIYPTKEKEFRYRNYPMDKLSPCYLSLGDKDSRIVYIVEGLFDGLSILSVKKNVQVIITFSTSNVDVLSKLKPLFRNKQVILGYDNGESSISEKAHEIIGKNSIIFDWEDIEEKDFNDLLKIGPEHLNDILDSRIQDKTKKYELLTLEELQNQTIPRIRFYADNRCREGVHIIAAFKKTGKSTLMNYLHHQLAIGGDFLGVPLERPYKVLFLALEYDKAEINESIERMKVNKWTNNISVIPTGFPLMKDGMIAELDKLITLHNFEFVTIDSWKKIKTGYKGADSLEDNEQLIIEELQYLSRKHRIPIYVIDHFSNTQGDVTGTYAKTGEATSIIRMSKNIKNADFRLHCEGRFVNYDIALDKHPNDNMEFIIKGNTNSVEKSEIDNDITNVVTSEDRGFKTSEIIEMLKDKHSSANIRKGLSRMAEEKEIITRVAHGTYKLIKQT